MEAQIMRIVKALALAAFFSLNCNPTPTPIVEDMRVSLSDMDVAQSDLATPTPTLVSVTPNIVPIGADTVITVTGANCHFDTWCPGPSTSFAPCVLNSFSSGAKGPNTIQYTLTVPAGTQPTNCNVTIQPRLVNSNGSCGANASALLSLLPAFTLK